MPEEIAAPAVPPVISTETIPSVTHSTQTSTKTDVDVTASRAISAAEKLGLKTKGQIMGPKDALGKSATPQNVVKADLKRLRERHTPKINVPRADIEQPKTGKLADRARDEKGRVLPKTDTRPAEGAVEVAKPEKPVVPPAPAKIKIGDKEMTPEEIEAQLKELREKAEATKKPEPAKEPDEKAKAEAEAKTKADRDSRRAKFITETAARLAPTEKDLDVILSGGKTAVEMLGKLLANAAAMESERLVDAVNAELNRRDAEIQPLLDQQKEISSYRTESAFLDSHPEIKDNPKAIEESRAVRQAMSGYYDQIQQKIAQGTATAEERAHAERYEKATPKEFDDSVAAYTKERLGITEAQKPAAVTPPPAPKPVEPVKPQPKPPTGQPVGGPSTPSALSPQQQHIARMRAAGV